MNWQQILWREWRHCGDLEYEANLFALIADQPAGAGSRTVLILLDSLAGAALALLAGFAFTTAWSVLQHMLWAGALIGGVYGLLTCRGLTWRRWLTRLQANTPTAGWSRMILSSLALAMVGGMIFGPLAWLSMIGLFWSIGGLIDWINSATDETDPYRSEDRRYWFWWRSRPLLSEVVTALQQSCTESAEAQAIWQEPLARLKRPTLQPATPDEAIQQLLSNNWVERFVARYRLVMLGQTAAPALQEVATRPPSPLQQTAVWLLHNINKDPRPERLLVP